MDAGKLRNDDFFLFDHSGDLNKSSDDDFSDRWNVRKSSETYMPGYGPESKDELENKDRFLSS